MSDQIIQTGNIGIGIQKGGTIETGAKIAGIINEAEQQNPANLQNREEQLQDSYGMTTTTGKVENGIQAVNNLENNSAPIKRILSALKAGTASAIIEAIMDHPLARFIIAALQDWVKTKEESHH